MTPQDAHLHLMSTLPRERIRTIQARPLQPDHPFKPTRASTRELNRKILDLKAAGLANHEIADELEVSRSTVGLHVNGKISTVRKAHR